jgi:glutathione S-transferase
MDLVAIVTALAVIEYMVLGARVGQARLRYGIEAPAISGHPIFERHFRIHQNTLEQLVGFLPALWLFATYVHAPLAAALGLVFIVARAIYAAGYLVDPKKRAPGAVLGMLASAVLLLGGLIGAVVRLIK